MPVAAFMSEPRLEQLGLTNYWGYNPIAFFAPNRATGEGCGDRVQDHGARAAPGRGSR